MPNLLDNWPTSVKDNWPIEFGRDVDFSGHMAKNIRQEFLDHIDDAGISVAEFSRRSGVSYSALAKLKAREDAGTSDENARMIRAEIEKHAGIQAAPALEESLFRIDEHDEAPNDATLVPVYDVHASAGGGAVNHAESEVYSLAFPPAYLKKLTSSAPVNLAIISVKGESMEPTLLDDDIVLLDATKTNLSYDGLFVIRFDDALHVKRVGRSGKKGHITIISDNRNLYPPFEVAATEVEAVGKVLWYGRKV